MRLWKACGQGMSGTKKMTSEPWIAITRDDPDHHGGWYVMAWRGENGVRGRVCWREKMMRDLYLLLKQEFEGERTA